MAQYDLSVVARCTPVEKTAAASVQKKRFVFCNPPSVKIHRQLVERRQRKENTTFHPLCSFFCNYSHLLEQLPVGCVFRYHLRKRSVSVSNPKLFCQGYI